MNEIDLDYLRTWIGKPRRDEDLIAARHARLMAATVDYRAADRVRDGERLPPLWHWIYFLEGRSGSELGRDGHPARGGFLPPAPEAAPAQFIRTITPTSTTLFRYSALTFNGHRIHYDADYCREVEGYANLVIHGPLNATLLAGYAEEVSGRQVREFSYRGLSPALLGDSITLYVMGANRLEAFSDGALAGREPPGRVPRYADRGGFQYDCSRDGDETGYETAGDAMEMRSQFALMANYNEWMNAKLYETADKLPPEELARDRKAFFGSILGTLNHIMVADILWLKRFATHPAAYRTLEPLRGMPAPAALAQILHPGLASLWQRRRELDATIRQWVDEVREPDLDHVLSYVNARGVAGRRRFAGLMLHFFNHQTHHRGQATTLLFQAGLDVGVTDLVATISNETAPNETAA